MNFYISTTRRTHLIQKDLLSKFSVSALLYLTLPSNMTEWTVTILDKPNSQRAKFESEHFAGIPALIEKGIVVCGGAIQDPVTGKDVGSHIQMIAESKEEILAILSKDTFAREHVWDLDNAIIHRFNCAVRQPLKE